MYASTDARAGRDEARKPVTVVRLAQMCASGERIAMLTCYDASFAAACDRAGADVLLVGDSLGMVVQGEASTLPVTLEHMRYHVACVARGLANTKANAFLIGDLPFASYHESPSQAYRSAAVLMQAGAQMVKIEGAGRDGRWLVDTIAFVVARGIPVCAHLGLTPQSVHQFGGYRVQGRDGNARDRLVADARAVEAAGASMLVLELMPSALAADIATALTIPVIGIGAGPGCDGQVLVLHDMLGIYPGHRPRFAKDFAIDDEGRPRAIEAALGAYVAAVKDRSFPGAEHAYD